MHDFTKKDFQDISRQSLAEGHLRGFGVDFNKMKFASELEFVNRANSDFTLFEADSRIYRVQRWRNEICKRSRIRKSRKLRFHAV